MRWYGKLIGALLGAIVGRGWIGAIDRLPDRSPVRSCRVGHAGNCGGADPQVLSAAFFRATFQVMGHVAKSDGRVTEQEIEAAREAMRRFSLSDARCPARRSSSSPTASARISRSTRRSTELRRLSGRRADLCRMFVQIQLEAALQGNGLSAGGAAGLPADVPGARGFAARVRLARGDAAHARATRASARTRSRRRRSGALADAYRVLGVRAVGERCRGDAAPIAG